MDKVSISHEAKGASLSGNPGDTLDQTFTIANDSSAHIRLSLEPQSEDGVPTELVGEVERDLAPGARENATVRIAIPEGRTQGSLTLSMLAYSTEDPESFVQSPEIEVSIHQNKEPPPKPRRIWPIVVGIVAVILVAGGGIAAWILTRTDTVSVPDLSGQTVEAAGNTLTEASLKQGVITRRITGEGAADSVVDQTPAAGAEAKEGSAVDLVVEAPSIEVPDVTGQSVREAEKNLIAGGLSVGRLDERSAGAKRGSVLQQQPAAGERAEPGSAVDLTVEESSVVVASVIGQTLAEAERTLADLDLRTGKLTERSTGGTPGVVLSHAPAAGQRVQMGTAVDLVVEAQRVVLPKLTGRTSEEAMREVRKLGLKVAAVKQEPSERQKPGRVVSQEPLADKEVGLGTPVTLVLAVRPSLSGTWKGNDGGSYYIRQTGSNVYWFGEKAAKNPRWSNVMVGRLGGKTVTGQWMDVPKGGASGKGELTLSVAEYGTVLRATRKTGGFGGSEWRVQDR